MNDRLGDYRMDERECWERLRNHPTKVGRLAFVDDGVPAVLPLNFRVDGTSIVFRTGPGAKLAAVISAQMLAFEADEVDAGWQWGWSVLAQGRAYHEQDRHTIRRLERLGLRPWTHAQRDDWIVMRPSRISGRQLI